MLIYLNTSPQVVVFFERVTELFSILKEVHWVGGGGWGGFYSLPHFLVSLSFLCVYERVTGPLPAATAMHTDFFYISSTMMGSIPLERQVKINPFSSKWLLVVVFYHNSQEVVNTGRQLTTLPGESENRAFWMLYSP